MNKKKVILILLFFVVLTLYFIFDLGKFLSLEYIKNSQDSFNLYYEVNPLLTIGLFFLIYTLLTAISFPGAAVMTLLAGALFGLFLGTIIVSFASTIGATLAMIFSRYLFQDYVRKKFKKTYLKINKGVEEEGAFYLFTLRLIPIFPFFLINIVMGLTKMKLWTYFWVSQLGMLAGTIVFVNAGLQLSQLESLSGILSFDIIISFVLLGAFPIVAKKLIDLYKNKNKT